MSTSFDTIDSRQSIPAAVLEQRLYPVELKIDRRGYGFVLRSASHEIFLPARLNQNIWILSVNTSLVQLDETVSKVVSEGE